MTTEKNTRPRAGRRKLAADQNQASLTEVTRNNIIAVATQEFVRHGYDGASINEIAKATDTSKRMVYYHFGSKQGLYTAVIEAAYERAGRGVPGAEVTNELRSAMETLRAYAEDAFEKFHSNENFVRLVMAENLNEGATIRGSDAVRQRSRANLSALEKICQRGVEEGTMRSDFRAVDLYFAIIGVSFHAVSNRISTGVSLGMDLSTEEELRLRRKLVGDIACRYAAKIDGLD